MTSDIFQAADNCLFMYFDGHIQLSTKYQLGFPCCIRTMHVCFKTHFLELLLTSKQINYFFMQAYVNRLVILLFYAYNNSCHKVDQVHMLICAIKVLIIIIFIIISDLNRLRVQTVKTRWSQTSLSFFERSYYHLSSQLNQPSFYTSLVTPHVMLDQRPIDLIVY